jgi:HAD superfamily hydrolase (TIGR01549 family)
MKDDYAVLFDVGGVLRDSKEALYFAVHYAFASHNVTFTLTPDEVWRLRGLEALSATKNLIHAYLVDAQQCKHLPYLTYKQAQEQAQHLITSPPPPLTQHIYHTYKHVMNSQIIKTKVKVKTGARSVLKALSKYKLGVVSNAAFKTLRRDIAHLLPFFHVIITKDNALALKPSPHGIKQALEQLGVRRGVLIGDNVTDYMAAQRAGVEFIGIKDGMTGEKWLRELGVKHVCTLAEVVECVNTLRQP